MALSLNRAPGGGAGGADPTGETGDTRVAVPKQRTESPAVTTRPRRRRRVLPAGAKSTSQEIRAGGRRAVEGKAARAASSIAPT